MIIFYDKPNMLSLPYTIGGAQLYCAFRPGRNDVADDTWDAIKSQNQQRIDDCYGMFLREFIPRVQIKQPEKFDVENIDITILSQPEALDLIENTMEIEDLEKYLDAEKKRKPQRKMVKKAIEEAINKIETFVGRIKSKKEETDAKVN